MASTLFRTLSEKDKNTAIETLIEQSTPSDHFFFMAVLSVLMASFGLLIDNTPVIIGSMLIAPLLSPILSLSLGLVIVDLKLVLRSFWTIVKAVLFSIPSAAIVTWIFANQVDNVFNPSVMSRGEISIIFVAIGFIAGLAASYALIKPELSAHLPGVAISAALIPPLAVTGIGIATHEFTLAGTAFFLFIVSTITVIFGSMISFWLMNLYVKRSLAKKAVAKEDAQLKREETKAEKDEKRNSLLKKLTDRKKKKKK